MKEEGVERNCPHVKGKKGELRMGRCRNGGINMEKVKPKAPLLKFWRLGKREDSVDSQLPSLISLFIFV